MLYKRNKASLYIEFLEMEKERSKEEWDKGSEQVIHRKNYQWEIKLVRLILPQQ